MQFWEILHAIELDLVGGNEIVGGIWIGLVSLTAVKGDGGAKVAISIGLLTATQDPATLLPSLGNAAGAVFGIGTIALFCIVGCTIQLQPAE